MEKIRTCRFKPYVDGPTFTLTLWDTFKRDRYGKCILSYRLTQSGITTPIFQGDDFCCSPLHGTDSDATVSSLMCFLTLQPGDTDDEYFEDYTDAQREFCEEHAEALDGEVCARFGDL